MAITTAKTITNTITADWRWLGVKRRPSVNLDPPPVGSRVRILSRDSGMSPDGVQIDHEYTVVKANQPERLAKRGSGAFAVEVPGRDNRFYVFGAALYTIKSLPTEMDPEMSPKHYTPVFSVKSVQTIDGWVGQLLVDETIVWQSPTVPIEAPEGTSAESYDPSDLAAKEAVKHLQSKFA